MIYILILVLFILVLNARSRISTLEEMNKQAVVQPAIAPQQQKTEMMYSQPVVVSTTPSAPTAEDRLIAWFKEDWIMKLGAFLLLIGFGWLVSYAFLHNWIGPSGRIALGIGSGALLLGFGWYRMRRYLHQGAIFLILGGAVVLMTVFKAQTSYEFFLPAAALVIMFATAAAVSLASVVYRVKWIAVVGLLMAAVAPFFAVWPADGYVWLFGYFFIVTLGTLWVVAVRGWRELTTAAFIVVGCYSAPMLLGVFSANLPALLVIMYAFTAVFFLFSTIGIAKAPDGADLTPDVLTAGGSGMLLLWWITAVVQPELQSLVMFAWAVIFLGGAFVVYKRTGKTAPFYVYGGVSMLMIGAATAAELNGPALTLAFTIEAVAMYVVAFLAVRDHTKIESLPLLFIAPVFLSFESITSTAWSLGVWHQDFFVLLALGIALFIVYAFRRQNAVGEHASIDSTLIVTSSIYLYVLLWLSLHAAMPETPDVATMEALVAYAVIGITCYFGGLRHEVRGIQVYGGVLLAFVVGRVLFIDVWNMELTGRIITFFILGILLMSTAFLGKKKSLPISE